MSSARSPAAGSGAWPATTGPPPPAIGCSQQIGQRLRTLRKARGLSLADVEAQSGGRWKAAVLSCYERAARAISAEQLSELAAFYSAPVEAVLPDPPTRVDAVHARVTLDLARLAELTGPEPALLARYATSVRCQRRQQPTWLLSLRASDLPALARIYALPTITLLNQLAAWQVLA